MQYLSLLDTEVDRWMLQVNRGETRQAVPEALVDRFPDAQAAQILELFFAWLQNFHRGDLYVLPDAVWGAALKAAAQQGKIKSVLALSKIMGKNLAQHIGSLVPNGVVFLPGEWNAILAVEENKILVAYLSRQILEGPDGASEETQKRVHDCIQYAAMSPSEGYYFKNVYPWLYATLAPERTQYLRELRGDVREEHDVLFRVFGAAIENLAEAANAFKDRDRAYDERTRAKEAVERAVMELVKSEIPAGLLAGYFCDSRFLDKGAAVVNPCWSWINSKQVGDSYKEEFLKALKKILDDYTQDFVKKVRAAHFQKEMVDQGMRLLEFHRHVAGKTMEQQAWEIQIMPALAYVMAKEEMSQPRRR